MFGEGLELGVLRVTIIHDALKLTVQGCLPQASALPPASNMPLHWQAVNIGTSFSMVHILYIQYICQRHGVVAMLDPHNPSIRNYFLLVNAVDIPLHRKNK